MAAIVIGRAYLKRARARDVACHGAVAEYVPAPPSARRNVNGAVRERGVTENTRETNESALVTFSGHSERTVTRAPLPFPTSLRYDNAWISRKPLRVSTPARKIETSGKDGEAESDLEI